MEGMLGADGGGAAGLRTPIRRVKGKAARWMNWSGKKARMKKTRNMVVVGNCIKCGRISNQFK